MRVLPTSPACLFGVLLCLLAACGDRGQLGDYLPDEAERTEAHDPLMQGPSDERTPTDVDHAVARGKLGELVRQIRAFQAANGALPERLDVLTPAGDMQAGRALVPDGTWRVPVDPWGRAYVYEFLNDGGFVVRSLGPDGETGTPDDLVEMESAVGDPDGG